LLDDNHVNCPWNSSEPFIAILDRIGLPTEVKEIKPGSKFSFDGKVRALKKELKDSTATVTVSAANPMIAVAPRKPAKGKDAKEKAVKGKEKKAKKK
jgi:hypothetical protein